MFQSDEYFAYDMYQLCFLSETYDTSVEFFKTVSSVTNDIASLRIYVVSQSSSGAADFYCIHFLDVNHVYLRLISFERFFIPLHNFAVCECDEERTLCNKNSCKF